MLDQDSNLILRSNLLKKYRLKNQNRRVVAVEDSSSGQLKLLKNQRIKKSINRYRQIKAMGLLKRKRLLLAIAFLMVFKRLSSLEEEDSV